MFDDFVIGPQSDEFIPDWLEDFEDEQWNDWEEYCKEEAGYEEFEPGRGQWNEMAANP